MSKTYKQALLDRNGLSTPYEFQGSEPIGFTSVAGGAGNIPDRDYGLTINDLRSLMFSDNSFTVGAKGYYPDLETAVADIGDRIIPVATFNSDIFINSNSNAISGSGTSWRTGQMLRVDDLIQVGSDTEYHRVKSVSSDSTITVYDNFSIVIPPFTNTEIRTYRLDYKSIVLLPGEHVTPVSAVSMFSGINVIGFDKYNTILSETIANPQTPFLNLGDNILSNFTMAPTRAWSDMDGISNLPDPNMWAGARTHLNNMIIKCIDVGGDHGNGSTHLPVPSAGTLYMTDCYVEYEHHVAPLSDGRNIATPDNTSIVIKNTIMQLVSTWRTFEGSENGFAHAGFAIVDKDIKARLSNVDIFMDTILDYDSTAHGPSGVFINTGINAIVEMDNVNIKGAASSSSKGACGIRVLGDSELSLTNCDIEIKTTSNVNSDAIRVDSAGAIVNIRNSRLYADSSSNAINCISGTVNENNNSIVGTQVGAGTINNDTPT